MKGVSCEGLLPRLGQGFILAKGRFQDEGKGYEASARTQVYLSKTKLRLLVGV